MVGETISHYKIVERLGGGGMGVVYKARDLRLDRFVALKFLPALLDSGEEWKKRFTQEAKAASSLDHPNICTIHHIGLTDDGQMFIVMGYYPGETLTAKIERGPLPAREAVNFTMQAAAGLVKAHQSGIVHRDIKPANIIVTTDGVVKILDFGLALLSEDTRITLPGSRLGTPAYMSPEQAQSGEIDHRTDIWSLGVVLYEMVSGKIPFKGTYDVAIIYSVINEDPEPIEQLAPDAPPDLLQVIGRALTKDPAQRYQHAEEMLADLESVAAHLDSGAPTVEIPASPPKLSGRKRLVAAIAAVLAIAAGGGLYLALGNHTAEQPVEQSPPVATTAVPEPKAANLEPDKRGGGQAESAAAEPARVETTPPIAPEPIRKAAQPKSQPRQREAPAVKRASTPAPVTVETAPRRTSPVVQAAVREPPAAPTPSPGLTAPAPAPVREAPSEPGVRKTSPPPPPETTTKSLESSELADWARVRNTNDVNALAAFLSKYPNGTLRQEALERMEELRWARASNAGSPASLNDFAREFPTGRHSAEAASLAKQLAGASSESAAVMDAVQRLARAYQQRDADAIHALWPSLSASQMASIAKSLHNARSVKYELHALADPQMAGGAAKVACRRSLQFEFAQGAQPPVEDEVSITLRKRGGGWFIESVQAR